MRFTAFSASRLFRSEKEHAINFRFSLKANENQTPSFFSDEMRIKNVGSDDFPVWPGCYIKDGFRKKYGTRLQLFGPVKWRDPD